MFQFDVQISIPKSKIGQASGPIFICSRIWSELEVFTLY